MPTTIACVISMEGCDREWRYILYPKGRQSSLNIYPWLKNSTETYTNITHKNPMYLTFIVFLVRDFHQR